MPNDEDDIHHKRIFFLGNLQKIINADHVRPYIIGQRSPCHCFLHSVYMHNIWCFVYM